MNMLEALKQAKETDMLARPVAWRGKEMAVVWEPNSQAYNKDWGFWRHVPHSTGSYEPSMPYPEVLFGEWEVISFDTLYGEGR